MGAFYNSPGFSGDDSESGDVYGISYLRASRKPCLVCGHPTGDCTGESGPPETIWGYNTNSSLDKKTTFYVEDDYYEERELVPGFVTRVLIHRKGKHIPLEEAKKLGLI
jgi:hypothetical protein